MRGEPLWEELRDLSERLSELEDTHVRRVRARTVLLAALVGLCGGAAGALLIVIPASEPERHGWLLVPGVPGWAALVWLTWRVTRRLTVPHGPIGPEYRSARRSWHAALARAAHAGQAPLSTAEQEERWRRIDALHHRMRACVQPPPGSSHLEQQRAIQSRIVGNLHWAVLATVLSLPALILLAFSVVQPIRDPSQWAAPAMGVPVALTGPVVARICVLRAYGSRRVTRTLRRGWRAELDCVQRELLHGAGMPRWRLVTFRSERFAATFRPRWSSAQHRSPAAVLRHLPDDAPVVRRWYWRHVGPGLLLAVGGATAAAAVATLMRAVQILT